MTLWHTQEISKDLEFLECVKNSLKIAFFVTVDLTKVSCLTESTRTGKKIKNISLNYNNSVKSSLKSYS